VGQRGHCKSRDYNFFYEKGKKIATREPGFFVHRRTVLAFERVEFVSDSLSYI
jgi:hypothetical protein